MSTHPYTPCGNQGEFTPCHSWSVDDSHTPWSICSTHAHTQTNRRPATPQTTQFLSGSLWFLELQLMVERHLFWVTQGSGSMAYQSLLHFASFRLWTYSTAWFNHDVLSDLHCFIHAVASLTILERWRREAARVPLQQVPLVTHWWLIDDSLRCTVSAPFELTKLWTVRHHEPVCFRWFGPARYYQIRIDVLRRKIQENLLGWSPLYCTSKQICNIKSDSFDFLCKEKDQHIEDALKKMDFAEEEPEISQRRRILLLWSLH